jgi:hypothetical protein
MLHAESHIALRFCPICTLSVFSDTVADGILAASVTGLGHFLGLDGLCAALYLTISYFDFALSNQIRQYCLAYFLHLLQHTWQPCISAVHDMDGGGNPIPSGLLPGHVVTCEPGMYFVDSLLEPALADGRKVLYRSAPPTLHILLTTPVARFASVVPNSGTYMYNGVFLFNYRTVFRCIQLLTWTIPEWFQCVYIMPLGSQAELLNADRVRGMFPFGGVRIEDNVAIMAESAHNLTSVPKTRADIEELARS